MKLLFAPAIYFLNQIRFTTKFALIGLICFTTLLVSNVGTVISAFDKVDSYKKELHGVEVSSLLLELQATYSLMDSLATASVGSTAASLDKRLESQFDASKADVSRVLQSLQTRQYTQHSASMAKYLETLASLNAVGTNERELFSSLKKQSATLSLLQENVSQESGQDANNNPDARRFQRLMRNELTDTQATLAQARGAGISALLNGLSSSNEAQLSAISEQLPSYAQQLKDKLDTSLSATANAEELSPLAQKLVQGLIDTDTLIQDQILMAMENSGQWQGFADTLSTYMFNSTLLQKEMLVKIEHNLEQSIEQQQKSATQLIVILGLALGACVYLFVAFYLSFNATLQNLLSGAQHVAQGDMTINIAIESQDEMGDLSQAFNQMTEKVNGLIHGVRTTSEAVSVQANKVREQSARNSESSQNQLNDINSVATAVNEMAATTLEVARNASNCVDSAHQVEDATEDGRKQVAEAISTIEGLAVKIDSAVSSNEQLVEFSAQISNVIDVIRSIAEQTSLLALNAAIEAARAGEQGRGFAVVADEVRTLASRTQGSTEEIEKMISNLQTSIGGSVKAMQDCHQMTNQTVTQSSNIETALSNITHAVDLIVGENQQIAQASEEQTAVTNEIDQSVVGINSTADQIVQNIALNGQASSDLAELANELERLVQSFKTTA